ncbi:hypothetical protein BH23BAC2_BH23BAC2_23550 [soil metagenome]
MKYLDFIIITAIAVEAKRNHDFTGLWVKSWLKDP